jgi:phage-related tail protein
VDWTAALVAAAGGGTGAAGIIRVLIAGWLKRREEHENRMEKLADELAKADSDEATERKLLEARVKRLEDERRIDLGTATASSNRLEKKIDALTRTVSNLSHAMASHGVKLRRADEDPEGDDEA